MHHFWTAQVAADHRARLRSEADDARLVAAAKQGRIDAARLRIRVLDPSDVEHMADLFGSLSWISRYRRFMSPREMSPSMLRYLAAIDHERHEAVGAFDDGRLVGAAHYFRLQEDPTQAEIGAEISDPYQHAGVGTALLRELAELACPRGITHFVANVFAENSAALGLLRASGWPRVSHLDGPVVAVTTAIPVCDP